MSRITSATAALILGMGCAYPGTPGPVTGNTALLAGDWEGPRGNPEEVYHVAHASVDADAGRLGRRDLTDAAHRERVFEHVEPDR